MDQIQPNYCTIEDHFNQEIDQICLECDYIQICLYCRIYYHNEHKVVPIQKLGIKIKQLVDPKNIKEGYYNKIAKMFEKIQKKVYTNIDCLLDETNYFKHFEKIQENNIKVGKDDFHHQDQSNLIQLIQILNFYEEDILNKDLLNEQNKQQTIQIMVNQFLSCINQIEEKNQELLLNEIIQYQNKDQENLQSNNFYQQDQQLKDDYQNIDLKLEKAENKQIISFEQTKEICQQLQEQILQMKLFEQQSENAKSLKKQKDQKDQFEKDLNECLLMIQQKQEEIKNYQALIEEQDFENILNLKIQKNKEDQSLKPNQKAQQNEKLIKSAYESIKKVANYYKIQLN